MTSNKFEMANVRVKIESQFGQTCKQNTNESKLGEETKWQWSNIRYVQSFSFY